MDRMISVPVVVVVVILAIIGIACLIGVIIIGKSEEDPMGNPLFIVCGIGLILSIAGLIAVADALTKGAV